MTIIKLIIGLPIVFIGNLIAWGGSGWYFIGCFFGLVGGYIVTKAMNHNQEGIGWVLIGTPMYLFAMLPATYNFFYEMTGDGLTSFTIRLMLSLLGLVVGCMAFTRR